MFIKTYTHNWLLDYSLKWWIQREQREKLQSASKKVFLSYFYKANAKDQV